jgi:hypothetical protein
MYDISGKGEPDANNTLPFVCSTACSNVHSDNLTGFDNGNMIGRGFRSLIARMISWVNAPWYFACEVADYNECYGWFITVIVERPSRAVGFTYAITSRSLFKGGPL